MYLKSCLEYFSSVNTYDQQLVSNFPKTRYIITSKFDEKFSFLGLADIASI